jgi:hypothetical protein
MTGFLPDNVFDAGNYRQGSQVRCDRQHSLAFPRTTAAESGGPSLPALQIGDLLARCYPGTTDHPVWHRTNVHRALPTPHQVGLGGTRIPDTLP